MEKAELIEELELQNPWWKGGEVPLPDRPVDRDIQEELMDELEKKYVTGIVGLRRAGKTTLTRILIKNLLKSNEPEKICYFSFDLADEVGPRKMIKVYSEEVLKEPVGDYSGKVYFFLDEVQKVDNWGGHVKSIQDKELDIKFTITGSSSMNITRGAGESLVGRIRFHKLNPFNFKEFLRYREVDVPNVDLEGLHYPRDSQRYRIEFNNYIEKGGFPELYEELSLEYLKQILDLIFFRDIVEIFTVKRTEVLKGLFRSISEKSGQKISYSNLANDLNTQYRTIKDYLQYLQDSFLITKSIPWEEDHIKSLRKNPKMYVADHSFNSLWKTKEGFVAETIAFNHLSTLGDLRFNNKPEVDIVLPEEKKAFEIKYSSKISKEDCKNLLELPDDYRLFLVSEETYDTWDVGDRTIDVIPLWLLALAV